jgi:hypothetical protein
MLERVAVHQTRLRTPGIGLDPRGVALGARGLVLLPSIEGLVAFLALYTSSASLEDLLRSLAIEVVRSRLGTREVALSFAADRSERMDRVAEVARLAGGYTFTGTSRHFVQYRDAAAPFGYDAPELASSDASLLLYHGLFSQAYEVERRVDLRALLMRLQLHPDPRAGREPGPRWIVAEEGLGAALLHYLVRSAVQAEVGVAEWPPSSSFDDGAPVRRYLFRLPVLPERLVPLFTSTPGLTVLVPAADGAAVEVGYRHPVSLRACPVFGESLVLFRGGRREPLELARAPVLGDVVALARVTLRADEGAPVGAPAPAPLPSIAVALRLVPTLEPWRRVTATSIAADELPLLRRVAYALGPETLRRARIAFTTEGAFLLHSGGVEAIPVGIFFRELRQGLFIQAGYDALPAVTPDVLFRALGAPADHVLFVLRDGRARGVPASAFVSLEVALLEAQAWAPLAAEALAPALDTALPEVWLGSVGLLPMRDIGDPPAGALE